MNLRFHAFLLLAGLCAGVPAIAVSPQVLEEIRSVLQKEALFAPDAGQLSALSSDNLSEMLRQIDPWAEWNERKEEIQDSNRQLRANIGAELFIENGKVWLMPYADGPLMQAGILDRVQLAEVNERAIDDLSLDDVASLLQGDDGQSIKLSVCMTDCKVQKQITVVLQPYASHSVEKVIIENQPVIRVRRFEGWETRLFLESELKGYSENQLIILDLRDCQGGDLFEAMDAASLFVSSNKTLALTVDNKETKTTFYSPETFKIQNPIVILTSHNTASAGEIFSGILQMHGRAKLVGSTTRGKCVSQKEKLLSDGSVLKFTNISVEFADGQSCQNSGLKPDMHINDSVIYDSHEVLRRLTDFIQ